MGTLSPEGLDRVSRIEIVNLATYQFVLDSHDPGGDSVVEISGRLADEVRAETAPAGDSTTLILRGTAGAAALEPSFKNIQGTFLTGIGSIEGTIDPLQISTGGPEGSHGKIRVVLPPGRAITVIAPGFGTMSTVTPPAPSERNAHRLEAEKEGAKIRKDLSGLKDSIEANVAAELRKVGLNMDDDE